MSTDPVPATPPSCVPDSKVMDPPLPALLNPAPATVRMDPDSVMTLPRAARWMEPPVGPEALMIPLTVMSPGIGGELEIPGGGDAIDEHISTAHANRLAVRESGGAERGVKRGQGGK